jgi:hypothetical protein
MAGFAYELLPTTPVYPDQFADDSVSPTVLSFAAVKIAGLKLVVFRVREPEICRYAVVGLVPVEFGYLKTAPPSIVVADVQNTGPDTK